MDNHDPEIAAACDAIELRAKAAPKMRAYEMVPDQILSTLRRAKRSRQIAAETRKDAIAATKRAKDVEAAVALLHEHNIWLDDSEATQRVATLADNAAVLRAMSLDARRDMIATLMATLDMI